MQVTITLNHLLILLFCGFLLVFLLYALQLYKNFWKELLMIAAKISHYQERIEKIEGQMESIAANIQHIREGAA